MKQIIALQEYTDKYISLYQGEIRNIETELANRLIEKNIVAEHNKTGPGEESGYSKITELTTLFEDNVHFDPVDGTNFTVAQIEQLAISADKINVTFDGIEYEVTRTITDEDGVSVYGNFNFDNGMPSFIEYPFCIISSSGVTTIGSNSTEENHNIKIEEKTETIETTEDFANAVKKVVNEPKYNYIIPEITMTTIRYDYNLDDGDVEIINYCDVTNIINTSSSNLWPIYVMVNGEITIILDDNDMNNYLNQTNFKFNNHSFALWHRDDKYWMCFPEAGEYTFSMYTITEDSGGSLKNIKDAENGSIIEGMIVGATVTHESTGQSFIIDDETTNKATGAFAHAEGGFFSFFDEAEPPYQFSFTTASGDGSHAQGGQTTASGEASHAEGRETTASGNSSHAEGYDTTASGYISHAEGTGTIANHKSQHVIGEFNIADPSTAAGYQKGNYVCIIGNGTNENTRSNALAIKWDGTFVFANGTEITPAQFQSLLALLN